MIAPYGYLDNLKDFRGRKVEFTFKTDIKATINYDEQVKMFVAYVPALGIYSQGETRSEAEMAIMDAVKSYLKVSHENRGK